MKTERLNNALLLRLLKNLQFIPIEPGLYIERRCNANMLSNEWILHRKMQKPIYFVTLEQAIEAGVMHRYETEST